jgi:hypothetical protein
VSKKKPVTGFYIGLDEPGRHQYITLIKDPLEYLSAIYDYILNVYFFLSL